ncbi:NADP-dependent aldehyde dehydrogenase [Spinactinospora alkalitolerans]|uniref:NADP-dependent aldehyde dehydrogenase n=1 Tax=Spinactinospora alkalitolerans TaxID=687207 RepID=A0A852TTZ9_9ACTN|nr:aldehyde dehydrogenase (NADP(+)) [Spinactinospora alkalitolerans]NYE47916.1 NADP-dependent aldehyde dehydrogenase [Spinactinospora alkalitolerans]
MTTTETTQATETSGDELDRTLQSAAFAAAAWGASTPRERARALTAVADALDAEKDGLVSAAERETGLPEGRLFGELARTSVQLRMFADLLDEGAHQRIAIDHADPDFAPVARPDLRRMLVPVGPVLVFAASNFPFAFSVAGGDTASALAAGCPVVLKAHPGHPETSLLTARIVRSALEGAGVDNGVFAMIAGVDAGVRALKDPKITAAAFTGSVSAGRYLFDIATSRPDPIPFYGELGSINPAFATREALQERPEEIAKGFVDSFTLGAGQFCTKPGLLLIPEGTDTAQRIAALVPQVQPQRLLTTKIADSYRLRLEDLAATPGVEVLTEGRFDAAADGVPAAGATLLRVHARDLPAQASTLLEESFGPTATVVEYSSQEELRQVLALLPGSLTVTVHTSAQPGESENGDVRLLLASARTKVGRIVFNGWPTGVSVTAAQQHGGPYPATTSVAHTSVGGAAIERFLRPLAYQGAPDHLLPPELQEENPLGLPRTVNPAGRFKEGGNAGRA